jgi:hypothetical protein
MERVERVSGQHAVAGLTEVLHALGAELRQATATATTGERTLLFGGAGVELDIAIEASAGGGFNFWVVDAQAGTTYTRTARVKVNLYPGGDEPMRVGK